MQRSQCFPSAPQRRRGGCPRVSRCVQSVILYLCWVSLLNPDERTLLHNYQCRTTKWRKKSVRQLTGVNLFHLFESQPHFVSIQSRRFLLQRIALKVHRCKMFFVRENLLNLLETLELAVGRPELLQCLARFKTAQRGDGVGAYIQGTQLCERRQCSKSCESVVGDVEVC